MKRYHTYWKSFFALTLAVLLLSAPLAAFAEGEANPVYEDLRDGVTDYFVLEEGEDAKNAVHAEALIDFTEYTNSPSSTDGFKDITLVFESRFKVPYQVMWDKKVSNLAYITIYDKASGTLFGRTESKDSYASVTLPVDGADQKIRYTYSNEIKNDYYSPADSQDPDDCYCLVTVTSTFMTSVPEQHTGFLLMLGAADEYVPGTMLSQITANPATWYVHFGTQEEEGAIVHDEALQSRFSVREDNHQGRGGMQSLIKAAEKKAFEQTWQAAEAKLMPLVPVLAVLPILYLFYTTKQNWKKQKAEEDSDAEKYRAKQQAALEEFSDKAEQALYKLRAAIERKEEFKQKIKNLVESPHFGLSTIHHERGYWEAADAFMTKCYQLAKNINDRLSKRSLTLETDTVIKGVYFEIMNDLHSTMRKYGIPRYLPIYKSFFNMSWKSSDAGEIKAYSLFPNDFKGRTYDDFTGVDKFQKQIEEAFQSDCRGLLNKAHRSVRSVPEPVHEVSVFSALFAGAAWLFALIVWVLSLYYHIGAKSTGFIVPRVFAMLKGIYFWVYAAIGLAIVIGLGNALSGLLVKDKYAKYHNEILRKEEADREKFLAEYDEKISCLSQQASDVKQEIFDTKEYKAAVAAENRLHQEDREFLNRWLAVWDLTREPGSK